MSLGNKVGRIVLRSPWENPKMSLRLGIALITLASVQVGAVEAGFITAPIYAVGISPVSVAAGDFNGDGIPDLAIVNSNPALGQHGTVSVLLGNSDGTFQRARNYTVGVHPRSVAVGDFNGDGHLDLAVANQTADEQPLLSILLGKGDGTFQAAQDFAIPNGGGNLAVGDFNGDGTLDLAILGRVDKGRATQADCVSAGAP